MITHSPSHTTPSPHLQPASLWRVITGFIVWAIAFVVLYAGHGLGCLYVPSVISDGGLSLTLILLWAAHLFVAVLLWLQSHRRAKQIKASNAGDSHAFFMWRVSRLIDTFSVGAIFVTGLPLLAIPACVA